MQFWFALTKLGSRQQGWLYDIDVPWKSAFSNFSQITCSGWVFSSPAYEQRGAPYLKQKTYPIGLRKCFVKDKLSRRWLFLSEVRCSSSSSSSCTTCSVCLASSASNSTAIRPVELQAWIPQFCPKLKNWIFYKVLKKNQYFLSTISVLKFDKHFLGAFGAKRFCVATP